MAINAVGEAVRQGKEIHTAEVAIATANAVVSIPFATVDSVQIQRRTASAPGLTPAVFTWEFTSGVLTIYAWQPTSATNPTLVAGTSATTVSVVVVGRRRQ